MSKTRAQNTHQCRALGCTRQVQRRYLMCRDHWYEVPTELRNEITEAWAEVQASGAITIRYASAVRNAVESIGRTYPLDNPPATSATPVDTFE